jgi:hypothetical protein
VEDQHVLLAGAEPGPPAVPARQPEPDRALVEADRAVEVGDDQLGGTESQGGGQRLR